MTLVVLLRHAHSTANAENILAGRTQEVHLSDLGRKQSKDLVRRLGDFHFKAARTSPLVRCHETVAPWLRFRESASTAAPITLRVDEDLSEVDYGLWTGKKIGLLSKDPLWKVVQDSPSKFTFPQGESMAAMQERAMSALERILKVRGKGGILLVSHGDVIKSIIAGVLNMPFDEFQRIVVDPASISILDFGGKRPRILSLNNGHSPLQNEGQGTRGKAILIGGGSGPQPSTGRKRRHKLQ